MGFPSIFVSKSAKKSKLTETFKSNVTDVN